MNLNDLNDPLTLYNTTINSIAMKYDTVHVSLRGECNNFGDPLPPLILNAHKIHLRTLKFLLIMIAIMLS